MEEARRPKHENSKVSPVHRRGVMRQEERKQAKRADTEEIGKEQRETHVRHDHRLKKRGGKECRRRCARER